jgi:hypothetical protein
LVGVVDDGRYKQVALLPQECPRRPVPFNSKRNSIAKNGQQKGQQTYSYRAQAQNQRVPIVMFRFGNEDEKQGDKPKLDHEMDGHNSIHFLHSLKVPVGHKDPSKNEQETGVRRPSMVVEFRKKIMKRGKNQGGGDKQRKPSGNDPIKDLVNFRLVSGVPRDFSGCRNVESVGDHQAEVAHDDSQEIDNPKELRPHDISQIRQGNNGEDVLQELQNAIRQGVRKEVASFHKGKGRFGRGLALRIAYF